MAIRKRKKTESIGLVMISHAQRLRSRGTQVAIVRTKRGSSIRIQPSTFVNSSSALQSKFAGKSIKKFTGKTRERWSQILWHKGSRSKSKPRTGRVQTRRRTVKLDR
ncbi:hypothetical protein DAI22_10g080400 [Oryza sativa Japonica Group]|nr:hypothetical protein DAI22_10g080400 [Oryza sativa Japonica Group]